MKNEFMRNMCMTMMTEPIKKNSGGCCSFNKTNVENQATSSICEGFKKSEISNNTPMKDCLELMNQFCCMSDSDNESDKKNNYDE